MEAFVLLISGFVVVISVTSCIYKYEEPIKSQQEFIIDKATYKCTKTNELLKEKK